VRWKTEKRRVIDLIPYKNNPRTISDEDKKQLKKSLKKFNLVEIPAVNTDGTILAGHQRIMTLLQLGRYDEEIDVRVPEKKLSEKEVAEYNIRSNKNKGEWDWSKLVESNELPELLDYGFESSDIIDNTGVEYVPNFEPEASDYEVSESDIISKKSELNKAYENKGVKERQTIICPDCHEEFYV